MKVIAMLQRWTHPTAAKLAGLGMLAALVAGVARPVLSAEAAVKIPAPASTQGQAPAAARPRSSRAAAFGACKGCSSMYAA